MYIYTYLRHVSVIVRIPLYFLQEGKTADEMEVLVGMYIVSTSIDHEMTKFLTVYCQSSLVKYENGVQELSKSTAAHFEMYPEMRGKYLAVNCLS